MVQVKIPFSMLYFLKEIESNYDITMPEVLNIAAFVLSHTDYSWRNEKNWLPEPVVVQRFMPTAESFELLDLEDDDTAFEAWKNIVHEHGSPKLLTAAIHVFVNYMETMLDFWKSNYSLYDDEGNLVKKEVYENVRKKFSAQPC